MNALKFFNESMMIEVGRIVIIHGQMRSLLLSALDRLFATELYDQGLAHLIGSKTSLLDLCGQLRVAAKVCKCPDATVAALDAMETEYHDDLEQSVAIGSGMWTSLSGGENPTWGLYHGSFIRSGALGRNYKSFDVGELEKVRKRVDEAYDLLDSIFWTFHRPDKG